MIHPLLRSLSRSPGKAVTVWACTVVWMAVAPAFLSLLAILQWTALPFPEADRIVRVNAGLDLVPALRSMNQFRAVSGFEVGWTVAEGPRGAVSVLGAGVDDGFFAVLASRPLTGRVFTPWLGAPQAGLLATILVPDRSRSSRSRPRWRLGFVCAALSLSVTLGAVTSVLRHSLINLEREPLGFEPRQAVAAVLRFGKLQEGSRVPALLARLGDRLRGLRGVTAVGFSDTVPFGGPGHSLEISTPEKPGYRMSRIRSIHGDYLAAAGMRLVAGHAITPQDEETGAPVALLDERGAREIFDSGIPPLGRTIVVGETAREVIGIVAPVKTSSVLETFQPQAYVPLLDHGRPRSAVAPIAAVAVTLRLSSPLREHDLAAAAAAEGAAVSQYHRLEDSVQGSLAPRRLAESLALLQWLAALTLVALATFGTFSWLLELRSFELAVRLALGDTRQGIAGRVLRTAVAVVLAAAASGLLLYIPVSRAVASLLFRVTPLQPAPLFSAVATVTGVALTAAALAVASALRRISFDLLKTHAADHRSSARS